MAKVLAFPPAGRKIPAGPPRGPAAILFFTGVRYESLAVKSAPEPRRRKSRRKA